MIHLTAPEIRDLGLLLEVNRRLLHPRGLALELTFDAADPDASGVLRVQDWREDPEGVYFDDLDAGDLARAWRFEKLDKGARVGRLGFHIQPLPDAQVSTFLRAKFAHHENQRQGTRLASWFVRVDRKRDQELALASVVLETGESLPTPTAGEDKARGVPILGMGAGAIRGSSPEKDVPSRMDRLRERIDRS